MARSRKSTVVTLAHVTTKQFQKIIYSHFKEHGRHDLPWRYESDPYKILISEVMLQQTQVSRVIVKYKAFLKAFPTVEILASASLADILKMWQGLGYNRRGKYLRDSARMIVCTSEYGFMHCYTEHSRTCHPKPDSGSLRQKVPDPSYSVGRDDKYIELLTSLPGLGPATAAAIVCYAFDKPAAFVETNIRAVYLYHFFKRDQNVSDKKILELVGDTMDTRSPRKWFYGLTDYGAMLKKKKKFVSVQSKHYAKQSRFEGSRRQLRGEIIRLLVEKGSMSVSTLQSYISTRKKDEVQSVVLDLVNEKLVQKAKNSISIV